MIVVLPRRCETMGDFCAFDRLHLNNKNKKKAFLFCIVFIFHYLCLQELKTN